MSRTVVITRRMAAVAAELVADGASNPEIADRLGVTEHTVKTHIKRLLAAGECENRTEFAVKVLRRQLLLHTVKQRRRGDVGDPLRPPAGAAR